MTSQRVEALQRAAQQWKRQLVDVSGRNRLVNYRDLKVGSMDLTPETGLGITPQGLESLLSGRSVRISRLIPDEESLGDARKRLETIYRRTQGHLDEKGINTLFAAAGLATWTVETGTRPNAPVILIPITLTPFDAARWDFSMELGGDAHLNPVLAHLLSTEFGIDPSDLDEDLADQLPNSFAALTDVLNRLASRWSQVRGMHIEARIVLGNFIYTNMPMVADLDNNLESFAKNDLVASIAGVEEARRALAGRIQDPSPNQPDIDLPESEFLVLDADSSQHRAINRVLGGASEVIWGPPGTGKSQTIANLIAALTAMGRRVLFVAEKRAAIDVVFNRLQRIGLDDLVMDAHGGIKSKREFAQSLADSMRSIRSVPDQDYSNLHGGLVERRHQLMNHHAAMHQFREPWNVTLYDVQAEILSARSHVLPTRPIPSDKSREMNREAIGRLVQDVQEWVDLGGHSLKADFPEWARSNVSSLEAAREALELVRDLASITLPQTRSRVSSTLGELGLSLPDTVAAWFGVLHWLEDVKQMLNTFDPRVYSLDHESLMADLSPARSWRKIFAAVFSDRYQAAVRTLESTLRPTSGLSGPEALEALEVASAQMRHWRQLGMTTDCPRAPNGLEAAMAAVTCLGEFLTRVGRIFPPEGLLDKPHSDLQEWLRKLASQEVVATNLCRIRELRNRLVDAGFGDLIDLVGTEVPKEFAAEAIRQSWLRAIWDDVVFGDPSLAGFNEAVHDRRQREFIELDQKHISFTPARVKRAAAENAVAAMNAHPIETNIVNREAAKRTRHLPIRKLFVQAPHVLTAIRPCWAMSPLLVAELIPADVDLFDVVVFDEASQIPPAEAIGVLARAPQAVIAGDDRQLPPTPFFARHLSDQDEDEEDDDDDDNFNVALTTDIESILDVAKASPIREELLQWHYRSRDERLISFSNRNIYQGALTTFPGISLNGPISSHLVPFRPVQGRSTTSHPDEVEMVVDMVIDHAKRLPHQSLGVITFGVYHAERIENALRSRLRDLEDHSMDEFFSEDSQERFFVKNIERVQGDERDVIFLSVGYHKSADGSLPYRFGPLNQQGGERRLNVAITRARDELHLVSSFSHHDMEPGRSTSRGVELLRQYLEFAASGGSEPGTQVSGEPLNGFELDVLNRLKEEGIPVTPQFGVGKYRLDFACAHPEQPGKMVLAIEADGASYHSGYTARERDRLRQQNLEEKGWRFHRIWSTSWFKDRDWELARAVDAWRKSCEAADSGHRPAGSTPPIEDKTQAQFSSVAEIPIERSPRPRIMPGRPVTDYSHRQLVALAHWILSDTLLRTDEDMHLAMRSELGFKRGGSRINPALQRAIDEARRSSK